MMNRGVMERQMFKKGGAAGFPDLNKDGDITQADILMGRGVKLMQDGGQVALRDIPGIEKGLDLMFSNTNTSTGAPSGFLREKFEEENPGYLNQMVARPASMPAQQPASMDTSSAPLSIAELANLGLINLNDSQNPVRMERGGSPTGQMATFVNPQSGERVTLDMANEADVQMMDQLISAGFVMDSPQMSQAPQMQMSQAPVGMQMGGDPMMAAMAQPAPVDQGVASMMPQEAIPAAPGPEMDMASMGVGEVDQATMEQMLAETAPAVGNPEEAESAEEMMNMIRGDEATVEQRRMELASIVGEEDAMQTPESVLALVQPVVQLSMVDQGIGGLAEQEMQQPVEGDMAGGIMSMMGG